VAGGVRGERWEYCLLRQHTAQEWWLYGPYDEKKQKFKGQQYDLAMLLQTLGQDGWEAVNMMVGDKALAVGQSYIMWPGNLDMQFLILFKRRR
jgi:hypothetical protein